ncbi:MAG: hypothetical protein IT352_07450 [Gemmatimonadales bacterium]|nr:hypothetical protein [Gemmatimonadales bacterium]
MRSVGWFGLGALAGLVLTGAAVAVLNQGRRLKLSEQRAAIRELYVRDSTRWAEASERFRAVADSLQRVRVARDSEIANAERTTVRLRDRLRAVRADRVDTLRVVVQQDSLIDALTTENATLRVALHAETMRGSALTLALAASDSALAAERVRAGALDALVRARLPAPPGKLLSILPKPSRGLMFVAGLAIGVAATR